MNFNQLTAIMFLLVGLSVAMPAVASKGITEGKDYTVLASPQPTQQDKKIEVLEFFWYDCPHCNTFHPHIRKWLETKSEDIDFRYVPAIFRATWVPAAKIFYAIEVINATDSLHDKIYAAIHNDKVDLNKESILFDWIEKQGIEREKFAKIYQSFAVQTQVSRSTQMSRQYKLSGVPALVIDGKYVTNGKIGDTPEDTIQILNQLIEKVRKERIGE